MTRETRWYELSYRATREQKRPWFAMLGEVSRRAAVLRVEADCEATPIDLKGFAAYLGVASIREVPLAMKGRLLRMDDGQLSIEVSCRLSDAERRFTVAHELSHIIAEGEMLRGSPSRSERSRSTPGYSSKVVEKLCDSLATELLLPQEWISRRLANVRPAIAEVTKTAMDSCTSIEAVADRIVELGLWNCRFLWWVKDRGYFRAVRSAPFLADEFLCFVRPENQRKTRLRLVERSAEVVTGDEAVLFRRERSEGRLECVRIGDRRVFSLLEW